MERNSAIRYKRLHFLCNESMSNKSGEFFVVLVAPWELYKLRNVEHARNRDALTFKGSVFASWRNVTKRWCEVAKRWKLRNTRKGVARALCLQVTGQLRTDGVAL